LQDTFIESLNKDNFLQKLEEQSNVFHINKRPTGTCLKGEIFTERDTFKSATINNYNKESINTAIFGTSFNLDIFIEKFTNQSQPSTDDHFELNTNIKKLNIFKEKYINEYNKIYFNNLDNLFKKLLEYSECKKKNAK